MLNAIVGFAIRFRGIVIALASLLVIYGAYSIFESRMDVFPEFAPPLVMVQTEAPGLSAKQVEVLVTQQVENALGGAIGLESMRSQSIQGLSVVTLTFTDKTNIYRARQRVAEQLSVVAAHLPSGVSAPALTPLTSSTSVVLGIGMTSDARSLMALRTLADWTVKPQLLKIPGVAGVTVFGGEVRQLQIQIKPDSLVRYGLSMQEVLRAAQRATGVRGGGFLENSNQRITLDVHGQNLTPEALGHVVPRYQDGVGIRLKDVAHVRIAPEPAIGAAAIRGKPGVILMVEGQYGADTMTVTRGVENALQRIKPALAKEQVVLLGDLFRPANFIQTAIAHLRNALLLGGILIIVLLFFFLYNVRTAIISATAIPLSLLSALIVLHQLGISLNVMVLGGLAIALGEVVDDAIVDVENIFRRLRENRQSASPLPAAQVVLSASLEVRSAVVYATFIVVLVFLPVLGLSGVAGRLFSPLATAYIFAILASLGVALTLTPALAYLLLAHAPFRTEDPPLMKWLKSRYIRILGRVEQGASGVIAGVAVLGLAGLMLLPLFGTQFLPELREGHFIVHVNAAPGTSLQESLRIGRQISAAIGQIPGVRLVAQRAGRAEASIDTLGTHSSEFEVDLEPLGGEAQEQVKAAIRKALAGFPGINSSVETFLSERVAETESGHTAQVVVNIFGKNLDMLDMKAQQVASILDSTPGAKDVQVQSPPGVPQLTIRLRQDALARWGFEPVDVMEAIQSAYQGVIVAQTYDGNRIFDVSVILDPASRQDPTGIGALPLRNPDGTMVPLRELADINQTTGPYMVMHNGAQRLQTVTANVSGRALSEFVKDAQQRVNAGILFPQGIYAVFTGAAEAQARAQRNLLVNTLMAGIGIVLLLSSALRSSRALLLVAVNLPFALVGGVAAVFLSGGVLSLGSLVGFVTLFGITLRNSIMLISHYQHLVEVEGMRWGLEAAMRGASERLTPILMTALVTALGLLPLALTSGAPGNEIEGPMAMVILGGLLSSTLLNLFVLPTLALRYGHFECRDNAA